MKAKQEQILELFRQGHSVAAIACRLDLTESIVRRHLDKARVIAEECPEGCLSVDDAARRIGMEERDLYYGIAAGNLRYVRRGRRKWLRMADVQIWLDNDQYRQEARAMMERLLAGKKTGGEAPEKQVT
jgi:DNA-binding transcriptional ArsR family regulator